MDDAWHIEATIGGWPGPAYSVQGTGTTITYEHLARYGQGEPDQEMLEVSPEELAEFWAAVDGAGVWDWAAEYIDENVLDGSHWSVTLEYAGNGVQSEGSNAFPKGFKTFCRALSRLCEGRPFE